MNEIAAIRNSNAALREKMDSAHVRKDRELRSMRVLAINFNWLRLSSLVNEKYLTSTGCRSIQYRNRAPRTDLQARLSKSEGNYTTIGLQTVFRVGNGQY
jgi:hypothetical protein